MADIAYYLGYILGVAFIVFIIIAVAKFIFGKSNKPEKIDPAKTIQIEPPTPGISGSSKEYEKPIPVLMLAIIMAILMLIDYIINKPF